MNPSIETPTVTKTVTNFCKECDDFCKCTRVLKSSELYDFTCRICGKAYDTIEYDYGWSGEE